MAGSGWSPAEIGDLTGKQMLVTGVTSGIGRQAALELARHGATVVLAARSPEKLARTRAELEVEAPGAVFRDLIVDVSDFSSVRRAVERASTFGPIDVLLNNAGVMATPYQRTADGLELQLATNHFGPFLLTGLLLPQLMASGAGRVVAVASQGHRMTRKAPLSDPRRKPRRYQRWDTYAKSKLADLLFTYELDRRLRADRLPVIALAAHPGYSATELMGAGRKATGETRRAAILQGAFQLLGQHPTMGAWPLLMAATADLPGSSYVGPDGPLEVAGPPRVVSSTRLSRDPEVARRLWELSEETTGVRYL